jgi:plasmid stability protein
MKINLHLPDGIYQKVETAAAEEGQSVDAFVMDAVRQALAREQSPSFPTSGWRAVFGKAKLADVQELQQLLDSEFA